MIFSVKNGSFSYEKKVPEAQMLLHEINFEASSGEIVAVLGPNGAGKTTLLRCMMGFLPWQSGGSFLDGTDIRSLSQRQIWQRIAYVPQAKTASGQYSVAELALLGRGSRFGVFGQPSVEDKEIVSAVLERLGIAHLAKRSCLAISGGELQMALIARALAAEPALLILDEPESNLDFKNQLVILDTMSRLAEEGMACIFNTHYPTHALQHAHKSLLLDKRGKHVFGNTAQVISEENIAAAFGVEAVIGEVETKHHVYRNILPLQVLPEKEEETIVQTLVAIPEREEGTMEQETRIAIIGIIVEDRAYVEKINALLHEYAQYIVGRMGMPYAKKDLSIISVIVDAPEDEISTLSGKLGMLKGISVKTTYSKR